MKLIITLFFVCFSFIVNAQLLTIKSADSLNGKPVKEFYTTAWIKMSGFYDTQGIPNASAMHLPSIPTDGRPADPHFHMDLYQTRLIFASRFQTKKLGEVLSYIETDFFGGGGDLRLRHAYVRFLNFRIGQTWSVFTDEEAWPNITDFDGPSTGAWVRSAQITYFWRLGENQDWVFSVETPLQDYSRYLPYDQDTTINSANQSVPDLVSHYELRWDGGHFQLAAVARTLEFKTDQNAIKHVLAGGFSLSGYQRLFKEDKIIYQAAYGHGISRYLVSFGGGGWDAVPDPDNNTIIPVPIYGGYVGFQHFWNKKNIPLKRNVLSSTFVYGVVDLENPLNTPNKTLLTGTYASANLYWNVVGPLNFATEGIYGFRTDEFGRSGDDFRLMFVMEYNF